MAPFIERMRVEELELVDKIGKLEYFTLGEVFQTLSAMEQTLLTLQLSAMKMYAEILSTRLFNHAQESKPEINTEAMPTEKVL